MLLEATDSERAIVVWSHAPPYDSSDFDRHVESIGRVQRDASLASRLLGVVVTADPDAPVPSALQRKATWSALVALPATARGVLVAPSSLPHGALTAMSWLGMLPFPIHAFRSWDAVLRSERWDEPMRERCRRAQRMYTELRG